MATRQTVDLHTLIIKAGIRPVDITDALHEKRLRVAAFGEDFHTTKFYVDEIRNLFWVEFGRYEHAAREHRNRGFSALGAATLAGAAGTLIADGARALLVQQDPKFPPLPNRSWAVLRSAAWAVEEWAGRVNFTAKQDAIALAVIGGLIELKSAFQIAVRSGDYVILYEGDFQNLATGHCMAGDRLADVPAGAAFSLQVHFHQNGKCTVLEPGPFYREDRAIPHPQSWERANYAVGS